MASPQLADAIEEYCHSREGLMAPRTIENDRQTLGYLLEAVGNIQTRGLSARHGEEFMTDLTARGMQASTLRGHYSRVGTFVVWLRARRYLAHFDNPLATTRSPKVPKKIRQRVPVTDFPLLLDCAESPRGRIVVALGLYVFIRASEVKQIRLDDVSLTENRMLIRQPKTGKQDQMPICAEMEDELRTWLTWYAAHAPRALKGSDFLVPAQTRPKYRGGAGGFTMVTGSAPEPEVAVRRPEWFVQVALKNAGFDLKDEWDKPLYEGCHTLRRSGARALYDQLLDRGYDGAIRTAQAMLHHESVTETEGYLGLDLDIKKRDDLLRGRSMFTPSTENVVRLSVGS